MSAQFSNTLAIKANGIVGRGMATQSILQAEFSDDQVVASGYTANAPCEVYKEKFAGGRDLCSNARSAVG